MIQAAQPLDLPECAALIARIPFFSAYFDGTQALRLLQERPAHHTVLVEREGDGGAIRGLAWFVERDQLSRGGYLKLFAVAPEAQGSGVAGDLLRACEEQVFAVSAAFFLMVSTANARATAFYRKHGYQEIGVIPDYAVPGQDERLMLKRR